MRAFKFISAQEVDVLIVDEVGSSALKYCIPNSATYSILPVRHVVPWIIKLRFSLKVSGRILRLQNIRESVIFSIVDELDPKVLITFIDNSSLMGRIQKEFPRKLCISVQNGFRAGFGSPIGAFSEFQQPTLYGFGEYENRLLSDRGIKIVDYHAVGSLRYGLYKKRFHSDANSKYEVCFVSEWISDEFDNDSELLRIIRIYHNHLFELLLHVCIKLDLSLSIAMRSEKYSAAYKEEVKFFSGADEQGFATCIPNDSSRYGSYQVVFSSRVVVCIFSTLGFEALGSGRKVLFGAALENRKLVNLLDAEECFSKFKSFLILNEFDENEIASKLKELMKMSYDEYINRTEDVRAYCMDNMSTETVDEIVSDRVQSFLNR